MIARDFARIDGSILSPAGACGVVGLKPTLGLVSRGGIVPISAAQDTAGPMTWCVADAAALLTAMAGPDPADPATARAADRPADYTAFLDPGALAGARLGIWRDASKAAVPAAADVLDAAVERLRSCGAEVIDPVPLPDVEKMEEPEFTALLHEFKHDLNAYLRALPGDHPMTLAELIDFNIQNAVLGDYPGLSTAGPAAVCGYPSISVPAGLVAGLPVGLTFMGPAWSEPRLLALAFAFERALDLVPRAPRGIPEAVHPG